MPIPATNSTFLEIVRKSNQVDSARLDEYLSTHAETLPDSPRKLAASLVRAGVLTLFQAEQFLLGKYKGFSLAGYRIIERIGIGGSGIVYLGEHGLMKRRVAIKILPTELACDPASRERFIREAQVAGMLNHPNIVHFFDFREENGLYAIIMEYVHGPNLQQLLSRRGGQPLATACEYIRQAALGLQHAHEAGLVHRDVKPANLLVDINGVVKVLDLGLARFLHRGEQSLTLKFNDKMVMGTADYMAPEQAMSLHDVDSRADIYSLGATLYALIVGHPPFHEGSIGQKLLWHQTKMPPRLNELRSDVPAALATLIERMMAKDPAARPASCGEVALALEHWSHAKGQPVDIRPSAHTLAEFHLGGPSAAFSCGTGGRLAPPATPIGEDTIGSQASEETGRLTPAPGATPTPGATPAPQATVSAPLSTVATGGAEPALTPLAQTRLLLMIGAFAVASGLAGGLLAMMLMGMRG
jgi:tRNA A-37 threonylcarbamoyl transferase component Bud32